MPTNHPLPTQNFNPKNIETYLLKLTPSRTDMINELSPIKFEPWENPGNVMSQLMWLSKNKTYDHLQKKRA